MLINCETLVSQLETRAYRMRRCEIRRIWSARGLAKLGSVCFWSGKAASKTDL